MDEEVSNKKKPQIISFDLEVSPAVGWFYPPTWETRVLKVEDRQKLMSFAWNIVGETTRRKVNGKWEKTPMVHALSMYDMPSYKKNPQDDKEIVEKLHEVMSQADILLGQNSDKFDVKMANYFFVKNGLDPIPPTKQLDTKKIASRYFRFPNNTLDTLGEELGVGGKTDITQGDIWYDCYVKGDKKAWKLMNEYCKNDVRVTTDIYMKMRGFMRNHPSMSRISGDWDSCPRCGSFSYRIKAYRTSNTSKYRQYQCNDCRGFFSDRKAVTEKEGDIKPSFTNI